MTSGIITKDAGGLSATEQMVLRAVSRAADAGEPCPKNNALAELLDVSSIATPARILGTLEKKGFVKVERFSCGRIVTVVATGKSTGGKRGNPHFSLSRAKGPARTKAAAPKRNDTPPDIEEVFIPAEQICFVCGTRASVGCSHRTARAGVFFDHEVSAFAEHLSETGRIDVSAKAMGWDADTACVVFERICRELGAQAA